MKLLQEIIKNSSQPVIVVSRDDLVAKNCLKNIANYLQIDRSDLIEFEPIEGVKALREKIADLNIKPHSSKFRFMTVFLADTLNLEQANTLLKILEEPPEYSRIILFTRSLSKIIKTIKSRCQKHTVEGARLSGGKSFARYFARQNFNDFLKKLKEVETEEIPAILEDTMNDLKEKGMSESEIKLYQQLSRGLMLSSYTNANRKLILESIFVRWKALKEK